MNPVFAHRKKAVVLDAMRLFRKTLATYRSGAEPQGGEIPDVVACDFRLCAGRKPLEGLPDANFALFAFTNRIAAAPRVAVNARVVVVGATETALATVDRRPHPTGVQQRRARRRGRGLVIQKNGGAGSAAYDAAGVAKLALGPPRARRWCGRGDDGPGPREQGGVALGRNRAPVRRPRARDGAQGPDARRDGRRGRRPDRAPGRSGLEPHARGGGGDRERARVRRHARGAGRDAKAPERRGEARSRPRDRAAERRRRALPAPLRDGSGAPDPGARAGGARGAG